MLRRPFPAPTHNSGHADTSEFSEADGRVHRFRDHGLGIPDADERRSPLPRGHPGGSKGIEHVVVLMMENRSFDHFLGWLPGADGRHDMVYESTDGNFYPNYPLAPDFQGCGYSDPDHSWEGFLVQHNFGKMDGFLQRPTAPANNPGVTLAQANTFPIGYYTNRHPTSRRKAVARPARHRRAGRALHGPRSVLLLVRGRDLPEPLLPARGADRSRPQHRGALHAADHLGSALADSQHPGHSRPVGTFSGTCRSRAVGHQVPSASGTRSRAGDTDALGIPMTTPSFIDGARKEIYRTSASSTRPSTPRGTAPRPTIIRWRTSASGSASSPTPTTRSPTPVIWTTRYSS